MLAYVRVIVYVQMPVCTHMDETPGRWMHEGVGFEGVILCACMYLCACDCAYAIRVHMDEGACTNKTVIVTVRMSMYPAYVSLVCIWA